MPYKFYSPLTARTHWLLGQSCELFTECPELALILEITESHRTDGGLSAVSVILPRLLSDALIHSTEDRGLGTGLGALHKEVEKVSEKREEEGDDFESAQENSYIEEANNNSLFENSTEIDPRKIRAK